MQSTLSSSVASQSNSLLLEAVTVSPVVLKQRADGGDAKAMYAYSIVVRNGLNGEEVNFRTAATYRENAVLRTHAETIGTNAGIAFVSRPNIDNDVVQFSDKCVQDLNLEDIANLPTTPCGNMEVYSAIKPKWDEARNYRFAHRTAVDLRSFIELLSTGPELAQFDEFFASGGENTRTEAINDTHGYRQTIYYYYANFDCSALSLKINSTVILDPELERIADHSRRNLGVTLDRIGLENFCQQNPSTIYFTPRGLRDFLILNGWQVLEIQDGGMSTTVIFARDKARISIVTSSQYGGFPNIVSVESLWNSVIYTLNYWMKK